MVAELYKSTWVEETQGRRGLVNSGSLSNRGLLHHALVTLNATLVGFLIGTGLGILLAVGIVHSRVMDMSVMPWAIVSQTIPIVALAPMIIVVLYSVGVQGLLPKAVISAYLSFFPVVVGMVKGLRSPDAMQMDLMRTYNASPGTVLAKLRLPASVPYLFASLKIAVSLFAMAIFLVLAGTLAQVNKDIWEVVRDYFRTPVAWIEWRVFFPKSFLMGTWLEGMTDIEKG